MISRKEKKITILLVCILSMSVSCLVQITLPLNFSGMFPYVCIATMPLFCNEDWPRRLKRFFTRRTSEEPLPSSCCIYTQNSYMNCNLNRRVTWKHRLVLVLLICHCSLQVFLPYSHFITKVTTMILILFWYLSNH